MAQTTVRILITVLFFASPLFADDSVGTLTRALSERATQSAKSLPKEKRDVMQRALSALEASGIVKRVIDVGDRLPDGDFFNPHGKQVSLSSLTKNRKTVLTFYRGGWCPYCNLQLQYYQRSLPEFQKLGAKLIAISPETPSSTFSTADKNALQFAVLSDLDNRYAKRLGLVFSLSEELVAVYQEFGIDLPKAHGSSTWELPLSATFIIDEKGLIIYRFLDVDYKKRAPVSELLRVLGQ